MEAGRLAAGLVSVSIRRRGVHRDLSIIQARIEVKLFLKLFSCYAGLRFHSPAGASIPSARAAFGFP